MDIKVDKDTVVVFDLDDTLYNELDFLRSAYRCIAMSLEPVAWRSLYANMFAMYRLKMNVFEYLATAYDIEKVQLIEAYREHQPDIHLFEGVLEVFDAIKQKHGHIGLVTDGRASTQRAKLAALGILPYLDKIVISEEIGSEKPCPANFETIMNSLPGNTYHYIADNSNKDFIAPNALGWVTISLIDNGKNIHCAVLDSGTSQTLAQHSIMDFKEINIV